ncbi:MAG: NAD(P)/FAD-dependent oxidoreductase [Alphaproteobacteria bacterium]|nr:NAD(P)/FAD-dependent oxidoreductase [Alphaproteobacteria bacterium]
MTHEKSSQLEVDALVLGAGVGGLCAAARLSHLGFRTLLVEAGERVGGRAGTEVIDGFHINTGAIAIEPGGVLEETFDLVGAPFDLRQPSAAASFRLSGKRVDVSRGGWGFLLNGLTKRAAGIMATMAEAKQGKLPDEDLTTQAWVAGFTGNETVHAIFRNLCAAIFAVNADELPARAFLTYFTQKGAFRRFGYCPRGTGGLFGELTTAIQRRGEVWLESPVEGIVVEDGRVRGARIRHGSDCIEVSARYVVSNLGPRATVALAGEQGFSPDYLQTMRKLIRPTANIAIHLASPEPLFDDPGIVTFGKTERLCNMANLSATCPELAPEGWHLYVAYAVPVPAMGDFDAEHESELALQDLRAEFANFDQARVLAIRVMRGDWPAQRTCAGFDMPQATPVAGLWNVGDGVKEYGEGGTQACAETARRVVEAIIAEDGRQHDH